MGTFERVGKNSGRSILVIDDRRLREALFAPAQKILKKIELLGAKMEAFHAQDQRQFDSWYQLTFRQEQVQLEERREELYLLGRMHNWIVAESEMNGISLAAAYRRIKTEMNRFAKGDETLRSAIEKLRRQREAFVEVVLERERREEIERFEREQARLQAWYDDDDDFVAPEGGPSRQALAEPTPADILEFAEMKSLTEAEIDERFLRPSVVPNFLRKLLRLSVLFDEKREFFRAWERCPQKLKQNFANGFLRDTGEKLEEVLAMLEFEITEEDLCSQMADEEFDGAYFGPDRRKFIGPRNPGVEEVLTLKGLYRKLVRLLHPDGGVSMGLGLPPAWTQNVWDRLQKAYRAQDLSELRRLHSLALLHGRDLNALTLDEISAGVAELEGELAELENQARELKKSPAWNFSNKRSTTTLEKNIRRDLASDLGEIEMQISVLVHQHKRWEFAKSSRREAKKSGY